MTDQKLNQDTLKFIYSFPTNSSAGGICLQITVSSFLLFLVPSAPSSVLGLCTVVVWGQPSRTNGQLTGYDLRFYNTGYEKIVWKMNDKNFQIVNDTDQIVSAFVQV